MIKQLAVLTITSTTLVGCVSQADIASSNLSKDADQFKVERKILFINGITGDNMLEIQGKCSLADQGTQLEVTCKTGESEYKKHFLGLSDNVTYFAEQTESVAANIYNYKVLIRPTVIVPTLETDK